MYSGHTVALALELLAKGRTLSSVSRELGVARSTLRNWQQSPRVEPSRPSECPRCTDVGLDRSAYAALLGFYLGDGCVSQAPRYFAFRVSCDARFPNIIDDVDQLMRTVRPHMKVFRVPAPGTIVVHSNWKHWPCLFPQHGPGRKHERTIRLEDWQQEIVDGHPGDFLRGLFHSDGSRTHNWASRLVGGVKKRYDYPRWEFVNSSDDIIDLCTAALDRAGIHWTRPRINAISVARAADVRHLDELIGPKT